MVYIKKVIRTFVIIYIAMLLFLYFGQRGLLYHPTPDIEVPPTYGLPNFAEVALTTADNITIKAWYAKPANAKKAVIYFIGNSDSLKNYTDFFTQLTAADIAVLGVCYRGYCGGQGEPTEAGLYKDADAALKFLRNDFADADITVIGRSLGSGVAVNLAHKHKLDGLVLISPYTSIPDVAELIYWYMPIQLLVKDRFESLKKIAAVSADILILHGDADELIPVSQGIELNNKATSKHALKIYKGESHNDLNFKLVGNDVVEFVGKQ